MSANLLLIMILLPAACGVIAFLATDKQKWARPVALLLGTAGNLAVNLMAYGKPLELTKSWGGFGMEFSLKLYNFNGFILICAAILSLFVAIYTISFSKGKSFTRMLCGGMLLTLALVNGAVLAGNLLVMLFFWEGILATMFAMIMCGGKDSHKAAVKAVVIAGVTDLCMMLGIALVAHLAKTLDMAEIRLPLDSGLATAAFVLLMIGAVSKAGSMPFHTWIPDAANDAPLPFMAFLPGALEKLLGVYLISRLCIDLFEFTHGSAMSYAMMILGAATIIFAVMMALIQKDFKRLLSYHAVSQVGYMILGIGTALPIGIIGGLFHMLNNAVYKCLLFLTAGAVEKQTGTTDLRRLGGLRKKMPITFVCFLVAAAAIAGFPLTNGFFSKEMIFDGALESGLIFYIIAAIGAFFTPVSFLKLGHAVFFGKAPKETAQVKEAPWAMRAPMIALAAACLALGFGQSFIVSGVLGPILGDAAAHVGGHTNWLLVGISTALLALAVFSHYIGFRRTGKGVSAADHFHHAPVLRTVYGWAERKFFDPYEVSRKWVAAYGNISLKINDGISRLYDRAIPDFVCWLSTLIRRAHNGSMARYAAWVVGGLVVVALMCLPLFA